MVSFAHIYHLLRTKMELYPGIGGSPARIGLACFLSPGQEMAPNQLCFCTPQELSDYLNVYGRIPHSSVAVIPRFGAPEELGPRCVREGVALCSAKVSLTELMNDVSHILYQNSLLSAELLKRMHGTWDIQCITDFAAQYSGAIAMVLNRENSLISISDRSISAKNGLRPTTGLLSSIVSLLGTSEHHSFFIRRLPDSGEPVLFMPLLNDREDTGCLILADPRSGEIDCEYLMELLSDALVRHITYSESTQIHQVSFKSYLLDMFNNTLGTTADNLRRLHALPYPMQEFMRPALLSFASSSRKVPYDYLRSQLRALYPNTNTAIIGSNIYFMPCYPAYTQDDMHADAITALITPFDGYACFSDGTHTPSDLHICFKLAERAISLARKLSFRPDPARRVYRVQDWRHFIIIDMCARFFSKELDHADLMYLVDRRVSKIAFYDKQHNTDLFNTLFTYLACNHSLRDTAEILHVHKNTVVYQLDRIRVLVGQDIPYGITQFNWISSCHFLEYLKNYTNDITYAPYDYHDPAPPNTDKKEPLSE